MTAARKRWVTAAADEAAAARLAEALALPRPLAAVLAARGLSDPEAARAFLSPRLSTLSDPFAMPGMAEAADRLEAALSAGRPITVFGDYDADGVTASALLTGILRALGGRVTPFIPCRFEEGYGLTPAALRRCLAETRPALIVTVDCGTNAAESVELAAAQGVPVIVTDHHEPSGRTAPAAAMINPAVTGPETLRDLAGVGIAFKLCHALLKRRRGAGAAPDATPDLREWLELVAIGTVADVAPLTGENRILVRHGLAALEGTAHAGLRALKQVAGVKGPVEGYHVGFVLGPRLNAAGRLSSGHAALDLLLQRAGDPAAAEPRARELDAANRERRAIEDGIRREAERLIETAHDPARDFGIVVAGENWHVGTVGIVASRLCSRFRRPVIVVAWNADGTGRGSGRSVEGLNLVEVLEECRELLDGFGGHAMAAGLELRREQFDAFRARFEAACAARLRGQDLRPVQRVDAWVSLGELDAALMRGLDTLRPFGEGNPAPAWGVRNVRVAGRPSRVGRDGAHLKLLLAGGAAQLPAIGFGMGELPLEDGTVLDAVVELKWDHWRGNGSLQLQLLDLAAAAAP